MARDEEFSSSLTLTSTSTLAASQRAKDRDKARMAMVTLCGYPCSGKSTRAQQLAAFLDRKLADPSTPTHLQRALRRVVVVNDEGLSISKHAYDGQFLLPLRRGNPPADVPPPPARAE